MTGVTFPESASGTPAATFTFSSSKALQLAQLIAANLATAVTDGTLAVATLSGGAPPAPGATGVQELLITSPLAVTVPAGYQYVIDDAAGPAAITAGTGTQIVSGSVGGTFFATGAATIVASGGNNLIEQTGSGAVAIAGGDGNDTIFAAGSGTVAGGAGNNLIEANGSGLVVLSEGSDIISVGAGTATSIVGGVGSPTVFGSAGATMAYYNVGSAGSPVLFGGAGAETLDAAGASQNVIMWGGAGNDVLIGGSGNDTMVSGTAATMTGGAGANSFVFFREATGGAHDVVTDFSAADSVFIEGFDTAQSAGSLQANASVGADGVKLTLSDSTTITFSNLTSVAQLNGAIQYSGGGSIYTPPGTICFLRGTHIATPRGEVPVEQLHAGDLVLTASGAARPIIWIGTGDVLATRGRRNAATPVIVRRGALAPGLPSRDLRVSKGHSLYLDGALIPVECLVNHRSIVWDDRAQRVRLYHIELETHDVLLANGAAAESYRDDGNRWLFDTANIGWDLPAQDPCAPLLTGGPIVDAVWRRLLDRAGPRPGQPLTDDPDLQLLADGVRVDAVRRSADAWVFRLAHPPATLRILSRSAAPDQLGLARDPRSLGVALRRITVSQRATLRVMAADDARLADGFHGFEADNGFRWTDGDGALPVSLFDGLDGTTVLTLHLGAATRYADDGAARLVA